MAGASASGDPRLRRSRARPAEVRGRTGTHAALQQRDAVPGAGPTALRMQVATDEPRERRLRWTATTNSTPVCLLVAAGSTASRPGSPNTRPTADRVGQAEHLNPTPTNGTRPETAPDGVPSLAGVERSRSARRVRSAGLPRLAAARASSRVDAELRSRHQRRDGHARAAPQSLAPGPHASGQPRERRAAPCRATVTGASWQVYGLHAEVLLDPTRAINRGSAVR